jgi:hypothetical protein
VLLLLTVITNFCVGFKHGFVVHSSVDAGGLVVTVYLQIFEQARLDNLSWI